MGCSPNCCAPTWIMQRRDQVASICLDLLPASGTIFNDDFETGDTSLWDDDWTPNDPKGEGGLEVTQAAAQEGTWGLAITPDSTGGPPFLLVVDHSPQAETEYGAFFLMRLQNFFFGATPIQLLRLRNEQGNMVARLDLRCCHQLRLLTVLDNGSFADTGWASIGPSLTWTDVRVQWAAATAPGEEDGYARLYINGDEGGAARRLDNDQKDVGEVWFGLTGSTDLSGVSGSYYLDQFESWRGPVQP
jgi:hypothetical protein